MKTFFFSFAFKLYVKWICKILFCDFMKKFSLTWGSNPRSWNKETHALQTELAGLYDFNEETVFVSDHLFFAIFEF